MTALASQVERLSRTPRLLVGCDFDGVLAPIVDHPERAQPMDGVVECLVRLAQIRQTSVAVVSGRSLASLRRVLGDPCGVQLVGSHGAEWGAGSHGAGVGGSAEPDQDLKARVLHALRGVAERFEGALLEEKPHGGALHYRNVAEGRRAEAESAARAAAEGLERVVVRPGKMVVEVSLSTANKGVAVRQLRYGSGATGVLYIGDDVTDEDAFRVLGESDLGVSVGEPRAGAHAEVSSPEQALELLRRLVELRSEWAARTRPVPISGHSLLSDQRTLAIVDPRGSVCWMCVPRVDGQAIFADLLGPRLVGTPAEAQTAGHFSVEEAGGAGVVGQRYVGDSMVLETRWPGFTVTDYLDCSGGRPFQRAGRTDLVRVIEGSGRVRVRFAARPDFGRSVATIHARPEGLVVQGASDPVTLRAPGLIWAIESEGLHQTAVAEVEVRAGEPIVLELRLGNGSLRGDVLGEGARRAATERFWRSWAGSLSVPEVAGELVRRSALTLKALVHGPTGAIVAAATTSLPEWPGGVRNWDYRFCWPRDACLSAAALVRLGNTGQAMRLLDWLLAIVDRTGSPERMRPIYTVSGEELGPEADITDLSGYACSRPVRVGNSAGQQVQLDIFGPVVELVWELARRGAAISPDQWRLVEAMVRAVQQRWHEPDNGIWEIRGPRRHYVHSKTMCWLAVDRAITLSQWLRDEVRGEWVELRERIRADVLEHGYDGRMGAFTIAYDQREADAACLHVGLSGLVEPGDARFRGTVEAVERGLLRGGTVLRYACDDGLPGREGGFTICLGWLIESLVLLGEVERARELFEGLCAQAGPTGLLAEQADPETGGALGNFPQAYSHLALINAAVRLSSVSGGAGGSG